MAANDQQGSFDPAEFASGLAESLGQGRFRVVLVLDDAPEELVRLVGFLETVTDKLVIDLVTVSAYELGGSRILVPQRVHPERRPVEPKPLSPRPKAEAGWLVEGHEDFTAAIEDARPEHRATLRRLCDWALSLEREGMVALGTYHGKRNITLLPRLPGIGVGLVTIYKDTNSVYLQFWRSVFERRAPSGLEAVERVIAPLRVGQGSTVREVSEDLLRALTDAYREASRGGEPVEEGAAAAEPPVG